MKKLSSKDYYIEKELSDSFVMELSRTYRQYIKLSDNCQYFLLNFCNIFLFLLLLTFQQIMCILIHVVDTATYIYVNRGVAQFG